MENENNVNVIENATEEVLEQTPNKNMRPCKICGKAIAKKAKTCPYCGAKNKKSHKGLIALLVIIIAVVAVNLFGSSIKNEVVLKIEGGEEITTKELKAIYDENQAKFKNNYQGKAVSFTATVKKAEYGFTKYSYNEHNDYGSLSYDSIVFEGGVELELYHGDHNDILNNISSGDKLSVSSEIQSFGAYGLNVSKIRGLPWHDESIISIVKE